MYIIGVVIMTEIVAVTKNVIFTIESRYHEISLIKYGPFVLAKLNPAGTLRHLNIEIMCILLPDAVSILFQR